MSELSWKLKDLLELGVYNYTSGLLFLLTLILFNAFIYITDDKIYAAKWFLLLHI